MQKQHSYEAFKYVLMLITSHHISNIVILHVMSCKPLININLTIIDFSLAAYCWIIQHGWHFLSLVFQMYENDRIADVEFKSVNWMQLDGTYLSLH